MARKIVICLFESRICNGIRERPAKQMVWRSERGLFYRQVVLESQF